MSDQGDLSHLELLKHDTTANTPERDRSGEAPEVNFISEAPQTIHESGLETLNSNTLPSSISERDGKEVSQGKKHAIGHYTCGIRRKWILWFSFVIILGIAAGVGIGLGIVSKQRSEPPLPPQSSSLILTNTDLKYGILNDSSFAAVSSPDGSKRVFFQDISGQLRVAFYSQSAQLWSTESALIVPNTMDARDLTPLAAILGTDPSGNDEFFLFYISKNNTIAARWYWSEMWATVQETTFVNLVGKLAAPGSRTLSVNTIPHTNGSKLFLMFEELEGTTTILQGDRHSNFSDSSNGGVGFTPWTWQNLTNELHSICNGTCGLPATSIATIRLVESPASEDSIISIFFSRKGFIKSSYANDRFFGDVTSRLRFSKRSDLIAPVIASTQDLTFPVFEFWVNGTRLSSLGDFSQPGQELDASFPFTRMATTTSNGTRAFSIFHQINESCLAQEVYDAGGDVWESTQVPVEAT